jgi:hypothetical protein
LETNLKMRAEVERVGGQIIKRFRIYQKALMRPDNQAEPVANRHSTIVNQKWRNGQAPRTPRPRKDYPQMTQVHGARLTEHGSDNRR